MYMIRLNINIFKIYCRSYYMNKILYVRLAVRFVVLRLIKTNLRVFIQKLDNYFNQNMMKSCEKNISCFFYLTQENLLCYV